MLRLLFRRLTVIAMALIAIGLLAFGPRRAGRDADLPPNVVVVDYWEKWTGNEGAQAQSIVDDFNATVGKQRGIFVRWVCTSSIDQKTLIATAAGVPPDIAGVWDNTLPQLAALDAIEPLEQLAAEHGITAATYKPVYWEGCTFNGHLVALISTPSAVALHMNLDLINARADALRAAGLDPAVPPRSIDELDRWARVLTVRDAGGSLKVAGYLPAEPGWWLAQTPLWFGGRLYDPATQRFTLTSPQVLRAMEWIRSYSQEFGRDAISEFRSGLGNFDSPQNAFLSDTVALEQQGPWMANFIRKLKPSMSGMTPDESIDAERMLPLKERVRKYHWAAVPFPSADPQRYRASSCGFDALVIPRGAKHKKEAFEFIAYVQRQDVHEKLNMLHCKNSALAQVSEGFLEHHPNPYIRVFEDAARSPDARCVEKIPIYGLAGEEINNLIQRVIMLQVDPAEGLNESQARLQEKLDVFLERQRMRNK